MQDAVQGVSPTTINYSKYLEKEQRWSFTRYVGFVQLANVSHLQWGLFGRGVTEDDWDRYYNTEGNRPNEEYQYFNRYGFELSK